MPTCWFEKKYKQECRDVQCQGEHSLPRSRPRRWGARCWTRKCTYLHPVSERRLRHEMFDYYSEIQRLRSEVEELHQEVARLDRIQLCMQNQ